MEPKIRNKANPNAFFDRYSACIFTNRSTQGMDSLRVSINLLLDYLCQDVGQDIFPPHAAFAVLSAAAIGMYFTSTNLRL